MGLERSYIVILIILSSWLKIGKKYGNLLWVLFLGWIGISLKCDIYKGYMNFSFILRVLVYC